jgi:hypothetical protein
MKQEDSFIKRPNTEDTILSDQPFCGDQFAAIKATLSEEYKFDVLGEGVDPMSHLSAAAITLDSIARWIYQENLISNK